MENEYHMNLDGLSLNEISLKYRNLYKLYTRQQHDIDQKNEKIFDIERKLTFYAFMEQGYVREIESARNEEKVKNANLYMKIDELEEKISRVKSRFNDVVHNIEDQLNIKDDEIDTLHYFTKRSERFKECEPVDKKRLAQLVIENKLMQQNIMALKQKYKELGQLKDDVDKQIILLTYDLKGVQDDYSNLKEGFQCKGAELDRANEQNKFKQEELLMVRKKWENMNKPLDLGHCDNSLFTEINLRRTQLETNLSILQEKYNDIKSLHKTQLHKMKALEVENAYLTELWKKNVDEWKSDVKNGRQYDEARIDAFQRVYMQQWRLYNFMKLKEIVDEPRKNKSLEDIVLAKDEEISELASKINKLTMQQIAYAKFLILAHIHVNDRQIKTLSNERRIVELQSEMDEMKSGDCADKIESMTNLLASQQQQPGIDQNNKRNSMLLRQLSSATRQKNLLMSRSSSALLTKYRSASSHPKFAPQRFWW